VWHVAAHEIGHAIYGLDGVKGAIKVSTKTLLEEPRAELTALHTMTLLLPAGLLTKASAVTPLLPSPCRQVSSCPYQVAGRALRNLLLVFLSCNTCSAGRRGAPRGQLHAARSQAIPDV